MSAVPPGPREQFAATATALLDERADVALLYAEISGQFFGAARHRHPGRVLNVGIREQLLIGASAGLALTGIRPIAHTFSPFLVSRAYEQIKLSLAHQGVGGVLVGTGASYDMAPLGRTHQAPEDVALMLTVPGARIHVPGTSAEVDTAIREAVHGDGLHYVRVAERQNEQSFAPGVHTIRRGRDAAPTVVAFGPVLTDVLAATRPGEETVVYVNRLWSGRQCDGDEGCVVRGDGCGQGDPGGPGAGADAADLRDLVRSRDVLIVEPWLEGTAAQVVTAALADRPRRIVSAGVRRGELRRYGTPAEHTAAHGLDPRGLRERLDRLAATGRTAA